MKLKIVTFSVAALIMWGGFISGGLAASVSDDRLVMSLTKTDSKTTYLKVNDVVLSRICGDADGCSVELGLTGYDFLGTGAKGVAHAPVMGPPCRFYLRDKKDAPGQRYWAISDHCSRIYGMIPLRQMAKPFSIYRYKMYGGGKFGTDGDATEGNWTVIEYLGLCYFSESSPIKHGTFAADIALGFYLIANDPADWVKAPNFTRWIGPSRTCELVIID